MCKCFNPVQFWNELLSIDVTLSPRITSSSIVMFLKADQTINDPSIEIFFKEAGIWYLYSELELLLLL